MSKKTTRYTRHNLGISVPALPLFTAMRGCASIMHNGNHDATVNNQPAAAKV